MPIRIATYRDAPDIKSLMEALGYTTTLSILIGQIENQFGKKNHWAFVYELNKEIVGFIAIHYLPQLDSVSEMGIITCLAVNDLFIRKGIGTELEQFVIGHAIQRKCDKIQLHCQEQRNSAYKFYEKNGYIEYPKFYLKKLVYDQ